MSFDLYLYVKEQIQFAKEHMEGANGDEFYRCEGKVLALHAVLGRLTKEQAKEQSGRSHNVTPEERLDRLERAIAEIGEWAKAVNKTLESIARALQKVADSGTLQRTGQPEGKGTTQAEGRT